MRRVDLAEALSIELDRIISDPSSTFDTRRLATANRAVLRMHPQSDTTYAWECLLCGVEGQTIDCTYPCDTVRVIAAGYGVHGTVAA